jgi:hypothetical protein
MVAGASNKAINKLAAAGVPPREQPPTRRLDLRFFRLINYTGSVMSCSIMGD